jgi:hypothetical protein
MFESIFDPGSTQIVRKTSRIRSRYLLPMELLLFSTLITNAMGGVNWNGWFFYALISSGERLAWVGVVMLIGVAGFCVSVFEWLRGCKWEDGRLTLSVWLRSWFGFFAAAASLHSFKLSVQAASPGEQIYGLMWGCLITTFFALWVWWSNRRTYKVLSPKFHTSNLEARLEDRQPVF